MRGLDALRYSGNIRTAVPGPAVTVPRTALLGRDDQTRTAGVERVELDVPRTVRRPGKAFVTGQRAGPHVAHLGAGAAQSAIISGPAARRTATLLVRPQGSF